MVQSTPSPRNIQHIVINSLTNDSHLFIYIYVCVFQSFLYPSVSQRIWGLQQTRPHFLVGSKFTFRIIIPVGRKHETYWAMIQWCSFGQIMGLVWSGLVYYLYSYACRFLGGLHPLVTGQPVSKRTSMQGGPPPVNCKLVYKHHQL